MKLLKTLRDKYELRRCQRSFLYWYAHYAYVYDKISKAPIKLHLSKAQRQQLKDYDKVQRKAHKGEAVYLKRR